MFIETENLILRKFVEDDFDDFCDYAIDDEMSRMMGRRIMHTKEDARWSFDWLKDREERCYGLVYKENNKVIGNLTVCNVPQELANLEGLKDKSGKSMSFSISKDYQRKGLMTEAIKGVVKELFAIEDMDYVQCGHYPFNTSSKILQEKLGFEYLTRLTYNDGEKEIVSIENILWRDK